MKKRQPLKVQAWAVKNVVENDPQYWQFRPSRIMARWARNEFAEDAEHYRIIRVEIKEIKP